MMRRRRGPRQWAATAGGVRWKNKKPAGEMNLEGTDVFACECCLSFRSWHWMSTVAEGIHAVCLLQTFSTSWYISPLLTVPFLSPLSHLSPISPSPFHFPQHTPSNSSLTFSIPHSIFLASLIFILFFFFFISHASQHPPTAPPYKHASVIAHRKYKALSVRLFPFCSLSSGKVVWCLQPLQSSIDNGRPLLIKLRCLHPLSLLCDRKIKC